MKKSRPKNKPRTGKLTEEDKLKQLKEFTQKWFAYEDASSNWVMDLSRLKLFKYGSLEWLQNDELFHSYEKILKENNVLQPDIGKLHWEATEAALPILDYLFCLNEKCIIPELSGNCAEGFEKWQEATHKASVDVLYRIVSARNKILAEKFKTGARIIPRSGWSIPFSITHWAEIFKLDRKTMGNRLKYNEIMARRFGSKWQIAVDELPLADDTDPRV